MRLNKNKSGASAPPNTEHIGKSSLVPIRYAPLGEIIRRYLHSDLVANCNLYEELPHLARDVGKYLMAILKANGIHRRREHLDYGSRDFNRFIVCICH